MVRPIDNRSLSMAKVHSRRSEARAIKSELLDRFATLTNRATRAVFRREMLRKARYYATLASKRADGSRFSHLAEVHRDVVSLVGNEAAPRRRPDQPRTTVSYPQISNGLMFRVHFLSNGSLRRERAAALSDHAEMTSRQYAATGEVFLSASTNCPLFYERLVETLGEANLALPRRRQGGFVFHRDGELCAAAARMADDNNVARRFSWRFVSNAHVELPDDPTWDPDPTYRDILKLTDRNDLETALSAVEKVDPASREILFDEVLYLKFCLRAPLRAQDLRYIARKYARGSTMRTRIEAEFDHFLSLLEPLMPGWDDLEQRHLRNRLPSWPQFRNRAYRAAARSKHPIGPRGRLFSWHPDVYCGRARCFNETFLPALRAAEDELRREHQVPRIGRRWTGETALVDLVRALHPDAVHQWSPPWLGRQAVDIYIPSVNVALEFQGEQHFRLNEFFGGESAFKKTLTRDASKRRRLGRHGVKLIEWHFNRPITEKELRRAFLDAELSDI